MLEISLGTHAQAAESTTKHGPFHDYEHHRVAASNGGRVRYYPVAPICDAHVLDHDVEFVAICPIFFMFVFAQARQLARTVSKRTHTLGPPVSAIEETNNNPNLHVISYRSRRGPLSRFHARFLCLV